MSCVGSRASTCRTVSASRPRAFRRVVTGSPGFSDRLDRLARLTPEDVNAIRTVSAELRAAVENLPLPDELVAAIEGALARLGEHAAYAVRSSATAEDLPTASFAGQQDSYLNVVGVPAILEHVRRCWASLFTERAVAYRLRNAFDHRRSSWPSSSSRWWPRRRRGSCSPPIP